MARHSLNQPWTSLGSSGKQDNREGGQKKEATVRIVLLAAGGELQKRSAPLFLMIWSWGFCFGVVGGGGGDRKTSKTVGYQALKEPCGINRRRHHPRSESGMNGERRPTQAAERFMSEVCRLGYRDKESEKSRAR